MPKMPGHVPNPSQSVEFLPTPAAFALVVSFPLALAFALAMAVAMVVLLGLVVAAALAVALALATLRPTPLPLAVPGWWPVLVLLGVRQGLGGCPPRGLGRWGPGCCGRRGWWW